MEAPTRAEIVRVSTLELFFDLVFVFTITQLTTVLVDEPTVKGATQVVLMFGLIWWMYGGYAWLTNAVAPDRESRRLLLLGGMAAFLVVALAIPDAFGDSGVAFGVGYVLVVAVHSGLFVYGSQGSAWKAILALLPFNITTALLVVAGGIAGGTATYVLWAIAVLVEWSSPKITGNSGFEVGAAHFVERHGLVVIVAIGESIVAIGIGASGLALDAGLIGVAILGLLVSFGFWYAYFGSGDDTRAEHSLAAQPRDERAMTALDAFGYWHMPILLGIVASAAGLKKAIGHASEHLHTPQALQLAGGVALFMAGSALFRRRMRIGSSTWRALAAPTALATVPIGVHFSAVAQLAVLAAVMAAALGIEHGAEAHVAPVGADRPIA
jgi:low temperature requirement protein LtrA